MRAPSFSLWCLGCSALLFACSGGGNAASIPNGDATASSSSSSSGDVGSGDGDGDGDDGSPPASSSSSSTSSSGGSSGVTPPKDTRLLPAEVGRTWTYAVTQTSQGQTTKSTTTTEVTGKQKIDGRDAWAFSATFSSGGGALESYADVKGDDVWIRYSTDPTWIQTSKAPVQEGASWTYSYSGTRKQTWHKAPATTVTAGTFDDCWRLDYFVAESMKPSDVNYSIQCRGVGTVLLVMQLSNGFAMRQELTAKSF